MQNAETYNFCKWVKSSKNGRKMVENQFLRFFGKKNMIFHNFSSQIIWKILILLHQFKEEKFCVKWCKSEVCILQLICGLPFQLQRTRKQLILCIGRCSANKNLYFHFLFAFFLPIPFYVGLRSKLDWTSEKLKQK